MVYVFLAEGFEEVEALAPVDLLRRAGVIVETVSINSERRSVTGARGIYVMADKSIDDIDVSAADMLVFPGGMPGTLNLDGCDKLMKMLDDAVNSGKKIAAICAAPAKILGKRGYLNGRRATCYPGLEEELKGALLSSENVVTDGNFITSKGLGTAVEFGLELIAALCGREKSIEIKKSVVAGYGL